MPLAAVPLLLASCASRPKDQPASLLERTQSVEVDAGWGIFGGGKTTFYPEKEEGEISGKLEYTFSPGTLVDIKISRDGDAPNYESSSKNTDSQKPPRGSAGGRPGPHSTPGGS